MFRRFAFIVLCYCIQNTFSFQSSIKLENRGTQFMPVNVEALYLGNRSARTIMDCTYQCFYHLQCRTFDFDTSTGICRLFQGDTMTTGSIVSASQTSVVGSIDLRNTSFDTYGQQCDQCRDNRFLRCVNGRCDCQEKTYWDGIICLSQYPISCVECQQNRNMCRTDLNLTCQSYNKCDYPNKTCNITDIPNTEATTEAVHSTSTPSIGTWIRVGSMSTTRSSHTSVLLSLQNESVLIAGGGLSTVIDKFTLANRSFVTYGQMLAARTRFTAAEILPLGHVLFVGGASPAGAPNVSDTAEQFDVNSGTITSMISTVYPWTRHAMTFLPSLSKWLLVGGVDAHCVTEFFDPFTLSFTVLNNTIRKNRTEVTATLVTSVGSLDDIVLITGGEDSANSLVFSSAELFNGTSGQIIMLQNNMTTSRYLHTATTLRSLEKVLICGGVDDTYTGLASCEVYDHSSRNFSLTKNSMSIQRYFHTSTLLNSGKILIVGGTVDESYGINGTELYDPITDTLVPGAPLNTGRFQHTATYLPRSGNILVCGGMRVNGIKVNSCELYYP